METNGTLTDPTNHTDEIDISVPNWIDADYFQEILALDGKSEWKYVSHDIRMASEKGENYAAVLLRATVTAENEGNNNAKLVMQTLRL